MCRVGNSIGVCVSHLEWRGDALGVFFAHMKNDQTGERPRDPRHIYANPLMPDVCPILALGMYWMCFPPRPGANHLFPGSKQDDRYGKILQRLLANEGSAFELRALGIQPGDIGTHSVRKGAATFVASGSTGGPSGTALNLRAGWALPGVQATYLRYEEAGDHFVGRTVSGLPNWSADFAILPPHFLPSADSELTRRCASALARMCPQTLSARHHFFSPLLRLSQAHAAACSSIA